MKKTLLPIEAVAAKLDLTEDLYEKRSPVSAKLSLDLLNDARFHRGGYAGTAIAPAYQHAKRDVT